VKDNQSPTLANPGDQTMDVIANTCAANYTITDPVSDNCTGSMWGYSTTGATTLSSSGNTIADGTGSGSLSFNQGVTTVTLTGTDGTNVATTVSFDVTVVDNQAPTLASPGDQTMNVIANTCAANYTIADPVSDNCTGSMWGYSTTGATTLTSTDNTIVDGTGSGSISFNKGVTTVTLTGTDGTNAATTVSFDVTVVDNQSPTLANPADQTMNVIANTCAADYSLADPISDNCTGSMWGYSTTGATTLTSSGNAIADGTGSGSLSFNKGVTTVTLNGTDGTNAATTVTFDVTVVDNQAPTLANPGDQTMNVIANTCAANYTITDPVSDNCTGSMWGYSTTGATTLTSSGNTIADGTGSGSLSFNKGVTTVTLNGTDGTNSAASVSFTVTVEASEINVKGGSPLISVMDGDVTPSLTDHTDFGSVPISLSRTYTIENTGTLTLNISGATITGTNAADFNVTLALASAVPAGNVTTFTVMFTPSSVGLKTAVIHIGNDDCDESDYDFAIQGTGSCYTTIGSQSTATQTQCFNETFTAISVSATGIDLSYQWYKNSSASTSGGTQVGTNSETYTPMANVSGTLYYYCKVSSSCGTFKISDVSGAFIVYPEFNAGSIKTDGETICTNCDPGEIGSLTVASGGNGTISYQWQSSIVNETTGFGDISGATSASYHPPTGLEITTWYRRLAHDGLCNTGWETSSGVWKVTVSPLFNSGDIQTVGETICYGGNPVEIGSVLDAIGFGLIHYRWQSSTALDFASPVNIDHDAATYDPPANLTVTTWFRRQAHDATTFPEFNSSHGEWKVSIETTPPTALAKNITKYLDTSGNATITAADIDNGSTDNCSIASRTASKTTFNCSNLGPNTVTLTVADAAGNSASANSVVTVVEGTALLPPWLNANTNPVANGTATYSPCTANGTFRLTATGQSTNSNDVMHYVYQSLTGNGTVIARLDDIQNGGWAGVMMRESNDPGAKTILFKTRLYNPNVLIGYRTTTNKNMVNLSQVAQLIHWMKIQRNGNIFKVFTSYNGTTWMQRYSGTIVMNNGGSIYAGIFTESVRSDRTSIAWFNNVELAGYLKTGEIETIEIPDDSQNGQSAVEIYPNPAKEKVTVVYPYTGIPVTLTMVSVNGKIVKTLAITANETQIDVSALLPGVYVLRMQSNESIVTRRLVIH
jgi:hypothetical protein